MNLQTLASTQFASTLDQGSRCIMDFGSCNCLGGGSQPYWGTASQVELSALLMLLSR
jgi:hypothetical protein